MRIIAFIVDRGVVDQILRHHAKAQARSPLGPPGAATSRRFLNPFRQRPSVWGVFVEAAVDRGTEVRSALCQEGISRTPVSTVLGCRSRHASPPRVPKKGPKPV